MAKSHLHFDMSIGSGLRCRNAIADLPNRTKTAPAAQHHASHLLTLWNGIRDGNAQTNKPQHVEIIDIVTDEHHLSGGNAELNAEGLCNLDL